MDANFRLKMKERGFKNKIYLAPGWAYFVNPEDVQKERDSRPVNEVEKLEVGLFVFTSPL